MCICKFEEYGVIQNFIWQFCILTNYRVNFNLTGDFHVEENWLHVKKIIQNQKQDGGGNC